MRAGIAGMLLAGWLATAPAMAAGTVSTMALVSSLNFGDFTVLGTCANCTITINAATGARTASGGVILRNSNGARAQYTVTMTGCNRNTCSYNASVSPATATMSTPGGAMTVQTFTTSQSTWTAISGSSARNTLYIGGTLRIPSVSVTPGTYTSGSYTITAN